MTHADRSRVAVAARLARGVAHRSAALPLHALGRVADAGPLGLPKPAGLGPAEAAVLLEAGVADPFLRPDRAVQALLTLQRWGPTAAAGYLVAAAVDGARTAVEDEDGTVSFAELADRARRLAGVLQDRGAGPGAPVALAARNSRAYVEVLVAAALVGADVLMVNSGMAPAQVGGVAADRAARLLVADPDLQPLFSDVPSEVPRLVTGTGPGGLDRLVDAVAPAGLQPPASPGRAVVLTSGTTGAPRGAVRPTPKGLGPAASFLSRIPLRAAEPTHVAAPLFHTWGYANLQLATALRSTLVLRRRFDPEQALAAVESSGATATVAVPVMLQRLLQLPIEVRRRHDVSSLRVAAVSGSALPGPLALAFMDAFGDILYNLYGSTEVSWAAIATPRETRLAPGTVGRPPLGTRILVLDGDGRPVPPGGTGAVYVGNELLFDGYTSGPPKDAVDGCLATGDLGHVDARGLLFVDGRADDMVVSGGENVFPGEVESALLARPEVRDAAVVGVPDERFGQALVAFVVPASPDVDAVDLREALKTSVARYAVPREVRLVDELPRNATGKVLARELREQVTG
ncbi:MAG: AMP-binding protein [Motilibacteraceae bacterium]